VLKAEDSSFPYVSASDVPLTGHPNPPRPLTIDEVKEYVQLYATAADNAVHKAGFDGVESASSSLPKPVYDMSGSNALNFSPRGEWLSHRSILPRRLKQEDRRVRRKHRKSSKVWPRSCRCRGKGDRSEEDWNPFESME